MGCGRSKCLVPTAGKISQRHFCRVAAIWQPAPTIIRSAIMSWTATPSLRYLGHAIRQGSLHLWQQKETRSYQHGGENQIRKNKKGRQNRWLFASIRRKGFRRQSASDSGGRSRLINLRWRPQTTYPSACTKFCSQGDEEQLAVVFTYSRPFRIPVDLQHCEHRIGQGR